MYIADILKVKGNKVLTVRSNVKIGHLTQRLRLERVGAFIVSETGETVDGIISERDVVYGLAEHGPEVLNRMVADLMTKGVVTCSLGDTIAQVAKAMTFRRIRHMPVTEGARLVGIISIGDVLKYRLDELELEANVMRDYAIAGR